MAFWSRKRSEDPEPDKLDFLRRYTDEDLELVAPGTVVPEIPAAWSDLLTDDRSERVAGAIGLWQGVVPQAMSNTIAYLRQNLADVDLLRVGTAYHLLYSVKNPRRVLYYVGGNPLRPDFGPNEELRARWSQVPSSIRAFYENLHDGFCYFASQSSGPDALRNVTAMAGIDWAVIEHFGLELRFDLATSFAFFNNGGSGYVVIDLADPDPERATVWWSDAEPTYDQRFWDVVDEWTVIGFE